MDYAIIGSGAIGTALSRHFARQHIDVLLANSRGPDSLRDVARTLGPAVKPGMVDEAVHADMVILAVPFPSGRDAIDRNLPRSDFGGRTLAAFWRALSGQNLIRIA